MNGELTRAVIGRIVKEAGHNGHGVYFQFIEMSKIGKSV